MLTGWTNRAGSGGFETFVTSAANVLQAINNLGDMANAYSNALSLTVGQYYCLTYKYHKNTAYSIPVYLTLYANTSYSGAGSIYAHAMQEGEVSIIFKAGNNDNYLYIETDFVEASDFSCYFDLELLPPNTLRLLQIDGALATGRSIAADSLSIPLLQMSGTFSQKDRLVCGSLTLPSLSMTAALHEGDVFGWLSTAIPAIKIEAYGGWCANLVLPAIKLSASGTVSIVGTLNESIPHIKLVASGWQEVLGSLASKIPSIRVSASGYSSIQGGLSAAIPSIKISASGSLDIIGLLSKSIGAINLSASASWYGTNTGSLVIPAIRLNARGSVGTFTALALNVKNFGLTSYTNFDYNSLCFFNGHLIGVKPTGLCLLEGDNDDGVGIPWRIKTGKLFFGFNKPRYCRLAGDIPDDIIVTVTTAEGESYEYPLMLVTGNISEFKAEFGKGIRSKYIEVELSNNSNQRITMDSLNIFGQKARKR